MEAFLRYFAVLVSTEATSKDNTASLMAHMYQVVRLSRARGLQCLKYDTEFFSKADPDVGGNEHANIWYMPPLNV